jgi:multidrug efflux pump subunit AcrA (membrane-fusion protein)
MTRSYLFLRTWLVAGLVLTIQAAIVLASIRAPAVSPAPAPAVRQPEPVPVLAEAVRRGDIQQTLSYSGEIRAREQINVLPKSAGRVERVTSTVTAKREGVLLVPRDAVLAGAVFTIEAGTVHHVPITVGLDNGQFVELVAGVDEGEIVATSALTELDDGHEVKLS